ncbi:MAG: calcium-binding protein, partial [Rhodobiaceae bacterium]|nr:calcium-binding protein [Rhodobiaceae bacterium]
NDTITGGTFDILIGDVDDMNAGTFVGGNDVISGGGNDDIIYGDYRTFNAGTIISGGNDMLYGDAGADMLYGNEGDDVLTGGSGDDTLDGGAGTDTANFLDEAPAIVEFVTVNLAAGSNQAVGSENGNSIHSIGTDQLTGIENVIGTIQGDSITGDGAANRLEGRAGNDFLDGGANADTLIGGADDDTYIVDNAGDVVTELSGEGTDTVQSTVFYILPDNVENLSLLDSSNINGVGNSLANVIIGNGGNNILDGVGGADTMSGGTGDDTYVVDNAGDIVSEALGQGTDQVNSSVGFTLFSNIENLSLVGSADIDAIGNELDNNIFGNSGNNTLDGLTGADNMVGGDGDDVYVVDNVGDSVSDSPGGLGGEDQVNSSVSFALFSYLENLSLLGTGNINAVGNELDNILIGNAGNNTLDGLGGRDTMIGNEGDDIFVVDDANDTVSDLATGGGTDQVNSSVSFALVDHIENLSLLGAANINAVGNTLANVLIGNSGNNTLDGLQGADTMFGGAGDDIYVIDDAGDTANEGAGEGTDQVNSSVSFALFSNIENLSLLGTADINATGNELGNTLIGNAGNNAITGNAGADLMIGNGGNDTYFFGNGSGVDIITDFSAGAGLGDVLYIVDFGFADFNAVLAAADDSGGAGPTIIQLDGDDSVTLQGVLKADLDADDFILV